MLTDEVKIKIEGLIASDDVVLFMKGRRRLPQCGFSARVVGLLDEFLSEYTTVNVLDDMDIREGIKVFSSWPTIPQLYVKGEFLGGCDIVSEMYEQGALHQALGVEAEEVQTPELRISPVALEEILRAMKEASEGTLRIEIDGAFRTALGFAEAEAQDKVWIQDGLTIAMGAATAKRAQGLFIDFVPGEQGGFRIENPNEPPKVRQIEPRELKARIDGGEGIHILDVRGDSEWETARVPGAERLKSAEDGDFDPDTPLAFLCHFGQRSQAAAEHFLARGHRRVYNIKGGIDAWSRTVDDSIPRY